MSDNGREKAKHKLHHKGKTRHTAGHEGKRGKIRISPIIWANVPSARKTAAVSGIRNADTMLGKRGKACLVTLTDRKSCFSIVRKATKKQADRANELLIAALDGYKHVQ